MAIALLNADRGKNTQVVANLRYDLLLACIRYIHSRNDVSMLVDANIERSTVGIRERDDILHRVLDPGLIELDFLTLVKSDMGPAALPGVRHQLIV